MKYQTTTGKSASDLDSSLSISQNNESSGYAPSSPDETDDESSEREVGTIEHLNRNTNTFVPRSRSRSRHPSYAWLNCSSNGNNPCHTIHVTPPVSLMSDYSHRQHSQCQQFKSRSCVAIDYSNPTTQLSKNDTFYSLTNGRDADLDVNCSKGCSVSESFLRKRDPKDFLNTFSKECKSRGMYDSYHKQCPSKFEPTMTYENVPYSREMVNTWNEPCARQVTNGMQVAHNLNCMSDFAQGKSANSLSNNCCNTGCNMTPEQRVDMLCQRYLSQPMPPCQNSGNKAFQFQDYGCRPQMGRMTPAFGNCSFGYNQPCPKFEAAKPSYQNMFRQNSCCDTFKPTAFCEPPCNPCDFITKYGLEHCGDNPNKGKEDNGEKGGKGKKVGKGKGQSPGKKGEKGDGKAKGETGKETNKKSGKGGKGVKKGKSEGGKEKSPGNNEFSCFNPCSAYTDYMNRTSFSPCGAFNPCGGVGGEGGDKTEKADTKGAKAKKGGKSKSPGPKGKAKGTDKKPKQTEDPCSGYTSPYSGCSGFTGYMTSPCAFMGGAGGGDKTNKPDKKGGKSNKGDNSKSPGSKVKGKGASDKKETKTSGFSCSPTTEFNVEELLKKYGCSGDSQGNKGDKKGGGKTRGGKMEGEGKKGGGGGNMKKEGGNNKGGSKVEGGNKRETGRSSKKEPVVDKLMPSRDGKKQSTQQSKGGKRESKDVGKTTRVGGCKDDISKGKVANTGKGARMSSTGGKRSRSEPGRGVNLKGRDNKTNQKKRTKDNDDSYASCSSKHVPQSQMNRDKKQKTGYTMSSNLNKQELSFAAKPVGHASAKSSSRYYKRSNSAPGNELTVRGHRYGSASSRNNSKMSNVSETLKLGVPGRSRSLNDVTLSSEKSACSEFNILMSIPCDITLEETNAIVESVKTIIMEKAASSKKKSKDRSRNHKRINPKISCMTSTSPGRCYESEDDTQADADVSEYLTSSDDQSDVYENKSRSRSKKASCDEKCDLCENKSRSKIKKASCDEKSDYYEHKSRSSRKNLHRKSRSTSSHNTDSDFDDVNFDAFDDLDRNESKHKKSRVRKDQPIVAYSQCKNPWWFKENKEDRREFIARKKRDRLNAPSANGSKRNRNAASSIPNNSNTTRKIRNMSNGRSGSRNQKKNITSPIRNKSPKTRTLVREAFDEVNDQSHTTKKGTTSPIRDRSPNNNNFTRKTLSGIGIRSPLDICQNRSNITIYTDDEASLILDFSENISNGTKCIRSKSQNDDMSTNNQPTLQFRKSDVNHNSKQDEPTPVSKSDTLESSSNSNRTKEVKRRSKTTCSERKSKEAGTTNDACDREKTETNKACEINKKQRSKEDDLMSSSSKSKVIQRRKTPLSARSERSCHSHSTSTSTSTITLMVEDLPLHPHATESNTTSQPNIHRSSRNGRGHKPTKRKRQTLADRPMWKCSLNTSNEHITHKKVVYVNDRPLIRPRKPSGDRYDHQVTEIKENQQHKDEVEHRSPSKSTDHDKLEQANQSNVKSVESQTSTLGQIEKTNGSDYDGSIIDMSQCVDKDFNLNRYRQTSHKSCAPREFESFATPMSPIRAADVNAVYSIFQTSQSTSPTAMFVDLEVGDINDQCLCNTEAGGDNFGPNSKLDSQEQERPQINRKQHEVVAGNMANIPHNAFEIRKDGSDLDNFSLDSLDSDKSSNVYLNESVCVKSYSSKKATAVSVSSMVCLEPTAMQERKSSSPYTCEVPYNTSAISTPKPTSRRSKHPLQVYDKAQVYNKAQIYNNVSLEEVTSDWYSSDHSDNSIPNTSISSDYNAVIFRNAIN